MRRRFATATAIALIAFAATSLAGCNPFAPKTQTINDSSAAFHLEVPAQWAATTQPGVISIYAGDKLPAENDAIGDTPWFFIYSANSSGTAGLDERVTALAKERAEARGWTKTTYGKPVATKLGGQPASQMTLSATDDQGRSFEGALVLGRTGTSDALLFAFSAPGSFDEKQLETVKKQFYWHTNAAGSGDTTETGTK